MLTQKEKETLIETGELLKAVRQGNIAAVGAKECLCNSIEQKRIELARTLNESNELGLTQSPWNILSVKLALSVCLLDGLGPKKLRWQPKTALHLRTLQHLEGREPIRNPDELQLYFLWSITQAIIAAGATPILEQWLDQSRDQEKTQQLIKELRKEAAFKRRKAKAANL